MAARDVNPIRSVGYIGMGIMGSAMATNLVRQGFEVTVWNRTASRCEPLREAGADVGRSPADLARREPDVICINVNDTPDVEQVVFGDDGLAPEARAGLIIVDHSTISPGATQQFAQRLADRKVHWVDAPVSGGDVGARNGTLSIMVGADEDIFERCAPLFYAVGRQVTRVGGVGMGQTCKACNQIAVACNLAGVCEAMALARKSGLDLRTMVEVVSAGAGGSWQLANLGPKIAEGDHDPGFKIDLMLKDLGLVEEAAQTQGLKLEVTALAHAYLAAVAEQGGGGLGTQAMAKALEQIGDFAFGD